MAERFIVWIRMTYNFVLSRFVLFLLQIDLRQNGCQLKIIFHDVRLRCTSLSVFAVAALSNFKSNEKYTVRNLGTL